MPVSLDFGHESGQHHGDMKLESWKAFVLFLNGMVQENGLWFTWTSHRSTGSPEGESEFAGHIPLTGVQLCPGPELWKCTPPDSSWARSPPPHAGSTQSWLLSARGQVGHAGDSSWKTFPLAVGHPLPQAAVPGPAPSWAAGFPHHHLETEAAANTSWNCVWTGAAHTLV